VTGSGAATSILGNALARGISYNYFRVDRVMKLKVLLKDGRIDETGFKGDLPICHLYR
jgi:4-cresol dehydrogenase (hydroxylating)